MKRSNYSCSQKNFPSVNEFNLATMLEIARIPHFWEATLKDHWISRLKFEVQKKYG